MLIKFYLMLFNNLKSELLINIVPVNRGVLQIIAHIGHGYYNWPAVHLLKELNQNPEQKAWLFLL